MWIGETLVSIESWLSAHLTLVTVIGIPAMTFLVTSRSNKAAETRAADQRRIERKLSQELKLVEFRQSWINELRCAFAEYHGALYAQKGPGFDRARVVEVVSKIILLMNPEDEDFSSLTGIHKSLLTEKEDGVTSPNLRPSIEMGQKILKREWNRLKSDLDKVDRIQ